MHNKLIFKVTADDDGNVYIENRKNHVVGIVDTRGLDPKAMTHSDYTNRLNNAIADTFRTNITP